MDAASRRRDWHMFPATYREHLEAGAEEDTAHARIVADVIASMTEDQAHALHGQLVGLPGQSGLDRFGP